jgi:hypothetical protein
MAHQEPTSSGGVHSCEACFRKVDTAAFSGRFATVIEGIVQLQSDIVVVSPIWTGNCGTFFVCRVLFRATRRTMA